MYIVAIEYYAVVNEKLYPLRKDTMQKIYVYMYCINFFVTEKHTRKIHYT